MPSTEKATVEYVAGAVTVKELVRAVEDAGFGVVEAPPEELEDAEAEARRAATPEELGVPKWQGTPEENTRMLRAAMRFLGASEVGMSEMDAHHKKLIGLYGDNISQRYWPFGSSPNWPLGWISMRKLPPDSSSARSAI